MEQQFRTGEGSAWYSPARDITVLTPALVRQALGWWEDPEQPYRRWLESKVGPIPEEDVVKVAQALASFMSEETLMGGADLAKCLQESGLEAAPQAARLLISAMVGELFLGAYFEGIRGATTAHVGEQLRITQSDPEELAQAAKKVVAHLHRPPKWRRWLRAWW
jgi:hypothetical protein